MPEARVSRKETQRETLIGVDVRIIVGGEVENGAERRGCFLRQG